MSDSGSLSGITVLDLSSVGPGSRCTAVLRDLGASVVKVLAPASQGRIEPPFFAYGAHRGMSRARIDLRAAAGRDAFLALAARADAIVESYRPGVAARLGVGYEDVRAVSESIVYAALSGYGATGPYAGWAGHDLNYLGVGGFLATQGRRADGGPAIPGATVADGAAGGWQAALAICAALFRRAVSGAGAFLDVSTTEGVLALTSLNVDEFLATGNEPAPGKNLLTGGYACYDVYRCRDGRWLTVAAIEPKFFANLCRALGLEHLAADQMNPSRQSQVREALAAAFATRPRDEWVAELGPADTCVAPALSVAEVAEDAHLRARGAFLSVEHGTEGRFEQVGPVVAGAGRSAASVKVPDQKATQTRALLRDAGMSEEAIAGLVADGVIE